MRFRVLGLERLGPLKTMRFFFAKTGRMPGLGGPRPLKADPTVRLSKEGRAPRVPGGRRFRRIPEGIVPVAEVGVEGGKITTAPELGWGERGAKALDEGFGLAIEVLDLLEALECEIC